MTKIQDEQKTIHSTSFAAKYHCSSKISDLCAETLVELSGVADSTQKPLVIFDNACGTGIVSSVLHRTLDKETTSRWQLTCGDMSQPMLAYTEQRIIDEGWQNVEAKIVDSQDTQLPSAHYTHVFTAFAFNLFPDPKAALRECFRLLQPEGTLAISVWQKSNWLSVAEAAVASLPGNLPYPTRELYSLFSKGWDSEADVRAYLEEAGFKDVQVQPVTKKFSLPQSEFAEACQMMMPFMQNKFWTQEQRDLYADDVPEALRQHLEQIYGKDGPASIEAVAIIATGRKP